MKQIIKGFQQFVNEDQGRAHSILRNIERSAHTGDNSVSSNAELYKLYTEDPVEYERLLALADRTKDRRFDMRNTAKHDRMTAFLKQKSPDEIAEDIHLALGGSRERTWSHPMYGRNTDPWPGIAQWIKDLANEFCESDMTLDDLIDAVVDKLGVSNTTQYPEFSASRNVSPSAIRTKFEKEFTKWPNFVMPSSS